MNPNRLLVPLGLLALCLTRLGAQTTPPPNDKVRLFNDLTVNAGESVKGDAVAVMGDATVESGGAQVGRGVLALWGDCVINGTVCGNVTAVHGDVFLGPAGAVEGRVVARGGRVHRDPKSWVGGSVEELSLLSVQGLPPALGTWWTSGLSKGRLLAPSLQPRIAWACAFGFLLMTLACSFLFAGPVRLCAQTLVHRPGLAAIAAVFGLTGLPVLMALLCVSVIGIPLALLFLPLAVLAVVGIGVTGVLQGLGRALTRGTLPAPLGSLLGAFVLIGVALVPRVGLAVVFLVGLAGLGSLIASSVVPAADAPEAAAVLKAGLATQALPRASFGLRCVAGLVDLVLIVVVTALVDRYAAQRIAIEPIAFALLLFTIYSTLMWRWNGATVGALLCGIRIVRIDEKPMDWTTSLVRVLGSQLSIALFGLGFLTVGLGKGRPAWHDRMAGTTAVRG